MAEASDDDELFDEWNIDAYEEYRDLYTNFFFKGKGQRGDIDIRQFGSKLKVINNYKAKLLNGAEEILGSDIYLPASQIPLYMAFLKYLNNVITHGFFNQQLRGSDGQDEYAYEEQFDQLFESNPIVFRQIINLIFKRYGMVDVDVLDSTRITDLDVEIIKILRDIFVIDRTVMAISVIKPSTIIDKARVRATQLSAAEEGYHMNQLRYDLFKADYAICRLVVRDLKRHAKDVFATSTRWINIEREYNEILAEHEKGNDWDPRDIPDEFHLFEGVGLRVNIKTRERETLIWRARLLALIGSGNLSIKEWEKIRWWLISQPHELGLSEQQESVLEYITQGHRGSISYLGTLDFYDRKMTTKTVSIEQYVDLYRCRVLIQKIGALMYQRSGTFKKLPSILGDEALLQRYTIQFTGQASEEIEKLRMTNVFSLLKAQKQEYAAKYFLQQVGLDYNYNEDIDTTMNMNDYLLEYDTTMDIKLKMNLLRKSPRLTGDLLDNLAAVAKQEFVDYVIDKYASAAAKQMQLVPYQPATLDTVRYDIGRFFAGLIPDDILGIVAVVALSYLQEQGIMCKVCNNITTVQCCTKNPYCSTVCQRVDWITHKSKH